MPNNPDEPFDYDTLKLRAVFVPEDGKDQVSSADIINPLGYDSVKIPAVFVPEGGTPPGFPYEHFGRTEFRPDEDTAATRKFTSGPSSSQPSDTDDGEDGEDAPAAALPRTRYRFGAALSGDRSPLPPQPALAAGQGDPVADGTAVWRGMKTPGAVWRNSPAAPSTMRGRATAAASGTENAPTAADGGAGVRDAPALQAKPFDGSKSIVQVSANEIEPNSELPKEDVKIEKPLGDGSLVTAPGSPAPAGNTPLISGPGRSDVPDLRRLHSDETTMSSNLSGFNYWSSKST